MISRPEVVTQSGAEAQAMRAGVKAIEGSIDELKATMEKCLMGAPIPLGCIAVVDAKIREYMKTTGRAPEYCDIGLAAFYDVYDWHVRHQRQIQLSRIAEQRMAIQYKFTQLVLRWENPDANFIGIPYDG